MDSMGVENASGTGRRGARSDRVLGYGCAVVLGIAVAVALCCGLGVAAMVEGPGGTTPPEPVTAPLSGSVVVGFDEATILYTDAQGYCREPSLRATETAVAVSLSFWYVDEPLAICDQFTARPLPPTASLSLRTPLGKRHIVDGLTGRPVPVFHQNGALHLAAPPAGWQPMSEFTGVLSSVSDFGGAGTATIGQLFARPVQDSPALNLLWIVETTGGWHPPAGTVTTPVTVRGHAGTAALIAIATTLVPGVTR